MAPPVIVRAPLKALETHLAEQGAVSFDVFGICPFASPDSAFLLVDPTAETSLRAWLGGCREDIVRLVKIGRAEDLVQRNPALCVALPGRTLLVAVTGLDGGSSPAYGEFVRALGELAKHVQDARFLTNSTWGSWVDDISVVDGRLTIARWIRSDDATDAETLEALVSANPEDLDLSRAASVSRALDPERS